MSTPFLTRCVACGHRWTAAMLPMPARKASRILRRLRCPTCSAGPDRIVADLTAMEGLER